MKKIISVKPVTEIELQFEDGESLTLVFNVEALLKFSNIAQSFYEDTSIPEICAKVIYTGAKDITLEDARALVSNLNPEVIMEIINEFNESMGVAQNGVQSELGKKLMAQFLNSLK